MGAKIGLWWFDGCQLNESMLYSRGDISNCHPHPSKPRSLLRMGDVEIHVEVFTAVLQSGMGSTDLLASRLWTTPLVVPAVLRA
jgi:hypothetical protein